MTTTTQQPPVVHVPQQVKAMQTAQVAIEKAKDPGITAIVRPGFDTQAGFELLQRQAMMFAYSSIVPEQFQGQQKLGDCAIVCEIAARAGLSPLFAFQNLYIVKGKPRWSGKAAIAIVNRSGLFEPLEFVWVGEKGTPSWGCYAKAKRKATGKEVVGASITMALVHGEGWWSKKDKNGNETSKWQTMPEQMFMYRAASFFLDTHYPEGLSGLPVENGVELEAEYRYVRAEDTAPTAQPAAALAPEPEQISPDDKALEPGHDPKSMQTPATPAPAEGEGAATPPQAAPSPQPAPAPAPAAPPKPKARGPEGVKAALAKLKEVVKPEPAKEPEQKKPAEAKPAEPAPEKPRTIPCTVEGCTWRFGDIGGHSAEEHRDEHVKQAHAPEQGKVEAPAESSAREVTGGRQEVPHEQLVAWCRQRFPANEKQPKDAIASVMREFQISFNRANAAVVESRKGAK